jgi:hypothetical protein
MQKVFRLRSFIPLLFVATGIGTITARASEFGLLLDKQFGQSVSLSDPRFSFKSVNPSGFGIRGAYTFLDLKVTEFGFSATYHPKAQADLNFGTAPAGKIGSEYIALGAQADWKFLLNLHLGVELRQEKISQESSTLVAAPAPPTPQIVLVNATAGTTNITRPWAKAGIGFSIPSPALSPFLRLEAAYALKTYSLPNTTATGDDLRKAVAPKYQVVIYGGIRF